MLISIRKKGHLRETLSLVSAEADGIILNRDTENGNICNKYMLVSETKKGYTPFPSKHHLCQKRSVGEFL